MVFSSARHLRQGWTEAQRAVDQWWPRLRTHVRDKGQHFEHLLN